MMIWTRKREKERDREEKIHENLLSLSNEKLEAKKVSAKRLNSI